MADETTKVLQSVDNLAESMGGAVEQAKGLAGAAQSIGKSFLDSINPLSVFGGHLKQLTTVFSAAWITGKLEEGKNALNNLEQAGLKVTRAMGPMEDYPKWQAEIAKGANQLGLEYNEYAQAIQSANKHHAALSMSQEDFLKFAKNASQFGETVGASASEGAEALGRLVGEAKVGGAEISHLQEEMIGLQNSIGMTGQEILNLINQGLTPTITKMKLLGASSEEINRTTTSVAKLTASFAAAGLEAGKAADTINKLLDPQRLTENVMLFNQLGININDAITAMTTGEGQAGLIDTLNDKLPELGKRVASMGMAGVQYAKSLGLDYKELLQYQNMSSEEAKKAAERNRKEREEQEKFQKQWSQTANTWQKWTISLTNAANEIGMAIMDAFGAENYKGFSELPIKVGRMFASFLKEINIKELMSAALGIAQALLKVIGAILNAFAPIFKIFTNKAILDPLVHAAEIVGQTLGRIIERLTPIIEKIMPKLGELGASIARAFEKVAPKIEQIFQKITPVIDVITSKMGDIIEKYIDPILKKIDEFATKNPEDMLAILGFGAGGGFLMDMGTSVADGFFASFDKPENAQKVRTFFKNLLNPFSGSNNSNTGALIGVAAGAAALAAAAKVKEEADRVNTSTQIGTTGRSVDISKRLGLDKNFTSTLEKQANLLKQMQSGSRNQIEIDKVALDLQKNQVNLEKIRNELLKSGEMEGYVNSLNAELRIKNAAEKDAKRRKSEATVGVLGSNFDAGRFRTMDAPNIVNQFEGFDLARDELMKRFEQGLIDPTTAAASIRRLDETLKSLDKTLVENNNKIAQDVLAGQMWYNKLGKWISEKFNAAKTWVSDQISAMWTGIKNAAASAANTIGDFFKELGNTVIDFISPLWDNPVMKGLGAALSYIKEKVMGFFNWLGSIKDWISDFLTGNDEEKNFASAFTKAQEKFSTTTLEQLTSGKINLKQAIQQSGVQLTDEEQKALNSGESDKIMEKMFEASKGNLKAMLEERKRQEQNAQNLQRISDAAKKQNEIGLGANQQLEQINKNTTPKRPVRMLNLSELAARAGESGSTFLTFGGR